MPSRMIHYLIAGRVSAQIPIADKNRFYIGSLCPDMSWRQDDSKRRTHYTEVTGDKKGMNWNTFVSRYREEMKQDDLYFGVLCHLITDSIWFCEMAEPRIRAKAGSKEERQQGFMAAYLDFHRLNYLLRREFGLTYELAEDRNISLDGIHPEFYDDVFGGLYEDFLTSHLPKRKSLPYTLTRLQCPVSDTVLRYAWKRLQLSGRGGTSCAGRMVCSTQGIVRVPAEHDRTVGILIM